LLGPYHVTTANQAPVRFEYDKVRALLAYLAVESDRPLRRGFLAGLFWPEQSDGDCPAFENWIVMNREQLRNQVLQALASLTDFHLLRQEFNLAQEFASQQIEIDSLREQAYRQIMIALTLAGGCTAALKWYHVCRNMLYKELEVDPDEETEKLHQLIKSGLIKDHYRDVRGDRRKLPPPPSPFFGRECELAGVAALMDNPNSRLVTLIGPGGVGKTGLALRTANDYYKVFTYGACFVPLAQLDSADDIYRAIAAVLHLSFQGNVGYTTQLLNYHAQMEMLIVLDNVEYLLPAAAEKIHALLQAARRVVIIPTATVRVNLSYEYVFQV